MVFPWLGKVDATLTAPIMLPFGIIWLVVAVCINGYHSELILDENSEEVIYRTSLVLHSWSNRAHKNSVDRVVLSEQNGRYQFVLEVSAGENLSITTFDYWRSREWSTQVAEFLDKPLLDTCRDSDEMSTDSLDKSILDEPFRAKEFVLESPPGRISTESLGGGRVSITIPNRRLFPSARPRLIAGIVFLTFTAGLIISKPDTFWWSLPSGLIAAAWALYRPLAQITHSEELAVSKNGLQVTINAFGRSKFYSFPVHEIREISVVQGSDARFEHEDFDMHAVCVEGRIHHLQLGAHLPKVEQARWLRDALLTIMTQSREV